MFSLIITVLSIGLVAALALAALYYGGAAYSKSLASADASQALAHGQQILAAADLFKVDFGRWPGSIDELVSSKYLKSKPGSFGPRASALAQSAARGFSRGVALSSQPKEWSMPLEGLPVFVLPGVNAGVCSKINLLSMSVEGVFSKVVTTAVSQCYGSSAGMFTMVVARDGSMLSGALGGDFVQDGRLPAITDPGWAVAPARPVPGGVLAPEPSPILEMSVAQIDFGGQPLGNPHTEQVVLSNTGNAPLQFTTMPALVGNAAFSVEGTTCGASLAAGMNCQVTVAFTPTVNANVTADLSVSTNAGMNPVVRLLGSGTGTPSSDIIISVNQSPYNLFVAAGSPTVAANYRVVVSPGVTVDAFVTGGLPLGSTVYIENHGYIRGYPGRTGQPGGNAISISVPTIIDNTQGYIYAGGGGGGGAASGGSAGSTGGWGQQGGSSYYWNTYCGCTDTWNSGGAPGLAVAKNGNTLTWVGGSSSPRVLGSIQ